MQNNKLVVGHDPKTGLYTETVKEKVFNLRKSVIFTIKSHGTISGRR